MQPGGNGGGSCSGRSSNFEYGLLVSECSKSEEGEVAGQKSLG